MAYQCMTNYTGKKQPNNTYLMASIFATCITLQEHTQSGPQESHSLGPKKLSRHEHILRQRIQLKHKKEGGNRDDMREDSDRDNDEREDSDRDNDEKQGERQ